MASVSPPDVSQHGDQTRVSNGVMYRLRRGCTCVDIWLQNASYGIVNHALWKILIVLLTILLLFGPPFQLWLIPPSGDKVMDVSYFIGFVIFAIDMILHSYLDPNYLPFVPCNPNHRINKNVCVNRGSYLLGFVGSFGFWCDFVSTMCFLVEISIFFQWRFASAIQIIELNKFGFPNPGEFAKGTGTEHLVVRPDSMSLIILIFKTLRVARLVPPTKVVEISTKINVFWFLVRLTPSFYCGLFRERRAGAKRMKRNPALARSSWGDLEIGAVAMMRARKKVEKEMKQKGKVAYAWYILKTRIENTLRFFHILPGTNLELKRQIAATRIQRAWRNRNAEYGEPHPGGEGSQAWRSTVDSNSHAGGSFWDGSTFRMSRNNALASPKKEGSNNRKLRRKRKKKVDPSQVGTAMAGLTGRSVAIFLVINLILTLELTYTERDTTVASTMVVLHGQTTTQATDFAWKAVDTARRSTIPNLYSYSASSMKKNINFNWTFGEQPENRPVNTLNVTVKDELGGVSTGLIDREAFVDKNAMMELLLTFCVLLTWFFGVAAFAGPIITLVINPIERAVKLLSMLVMDPLGYQNTLQYKQFLTESDFNAKTSRWSKEVLKGMETDFLMSTIVRIGSLMKVGFGSAGAQIIRNSLQKSDNNDTGTLILNSEGSMVSCIFLFCDIRSFTDATECLQEEVFAFTNQVAAVVHSICSSYGGSANKNIGDAFLVSWKLDEVHSGNHGSRNGLATRHQADKALLSVVKISIALHHDDFYVGLLSDHAKAALLAKFKDRPGPIVQLGFGLHAGKAIEGAIGSQRKIDATYVSMAVERAEYLETSTKKYKVNMLMSGSFHRLLQKSRRAKCRMIDRLMFEDEYIDFCREDDNNQGKLLELFTYDIDVDALFEDSQSDEDESSESLSITDGDLSGMFGSIRDLSRGSFGILSRRSRSGTRKSNNSNSGSLRADNQHIKAAIAAATAKALRTGHISTAESIEEATKKKVRELVLPTGPALYSENLWLQKDIKRIRRRYTTPFFDTYNLGLRKFYSKDWDEAKILFEANLDRFEDGPSRYFLDEMDKYNGIPPENFKPYGKE